MAISDHFSVFFHGLLAQLSYYGDRKEKSQTANDEIDVKQEQVLLIHLFHISQIKYSIRKLKRIVEKHILKKFVKSLSL